MLYFIKMNILFNSIVYRKLNSDLNNLNDDELKKHFFSIGLYEKRPYDYNLPRDFDHNIYFYLHTELNNNEEDLKYHYFKIGSKEGWTYKIDLPDDFDTNSYKELNKDLLINYNNDNQLKCHYFLVGKKENLLYKIDIPDDFDVKSYRELNPDVSNLDDFKLKCHYTSIGKKENRLYKIDIPDDFNIFIYRELYPEYAGYDDKRLTYIFLKNNINKNHSYTYKIPEDFDANKYRELNSDLKNFNDEKLKCHYFKYGKSEYRQYKCDLPGDFNCNIYRELNTDLKNLNEKQLKNHYILHGKNENRKYKYDLPDDFNCNIYKELNSDLKVLNEHQLKQHYISHGKNENREYKIKLINNIINNTSQYKKIPDDFNCSIYKELNNDLKNLNDEDLKTHYLTYGIHENRKYIKSNKDNEDEINNKDEINTICYVIFNNFSENKKYVENLLKNSSLKIFYINNMDNLNKFNLLNINYERDLTEYEICYTLSHVQAINKLRTNNENYYMIVENIKLFDNLLKSKNDFEDIIKKAPKFDILILYKKNKLNEKYEYIDWVKYYKKLLINDKDTTCYIISKSGVKKMCKIAHYENNIFTFDSNFNFDLSYIYLFKYLKTYVYKNME